MYEVLSILGVALVPVAVLAAQDDEISYGAAA